MKLFLNRLTGNPHTTLAAGIYVGGIWFPAHKEQFDQTSNLIESAAIAYGLVMAGDSKPKNEP